MKKRKIQSIYSTQAGIVFASLWYLHFLGLCLCHIVGTQKSEWICDWYNFKAESNNMLLEHSNKDRITGARGVAAAEMLNEGLKFH